MPSNDPSLIAGLDPAALFGLSAEEPSASTMWQPPSVKEAAKLFPNWKVLGLLGRGGMGAVYHIHQPDLDREVAVKLLPIEASRDERQVERFRREARTLAKLKHPGIVALHEAGITPEGHFFFVMEYIDGHPLSDLIAQGRMDVPRAIDIVRQVCDALAYAHGQGVVHRDIKPSNILIDALGHAKVADFGLAHWERAETEGALSLSRTGMFMGTPAYTAPEQARDAAHVDHRADLYSLGVLLYEMLTGELPRGVFQPPSRKAGSDARLDNVVQRALQERPEDRYQAASDLKNDVSSVSGKLPAKSIVWLPWTLVVLLLIAAGSIVAWPKVQRMFVVANTHASKSTAPISPPVAIREPVTMPANVVVVSSPPAQPPTPAPATPKPAPINVAKAAPPAPPPLPAPTSKPTAKVWSINPLPPALSPPDELMKSAWKDCALVQRGGAVLLGDGKTLAFWSEAIPGKAMRYAHDQPLISLAHTASLIATLDDSHRVMIFSLVATDQPLKSTEPVRALFSSPFSPWFGVITNDGKAQGWSVEGGKLIVRDYSFTKPEQLAIASETAVYCLDSNGRLSDIGTAAYPDMRDAKNPARKIVAGPDHLFRVLRSGELRATGSLDTALPPLKDVTDILTGDGFAIALDTTGRLIVWGKDVPDSPQRMQMPEGTTHLRASPLGLLAAW